MYRRLGEGNARRDYYDRFDREEYERRWERLDELMDEEGYDALVCFGNAGFQGAIVEYLTNYSPKFLAYLVLFRNPDEAPTLYVGISNHLQYAREVGEITDVRVMLPDPGERIAQRLAEADERPETVGLVGVDTRYGNGMPADHTSALEREFDGELVDATAGVIRLSSIRSDEEITRVKEAASILDEGMEALASAISVGTTERELESVLASALAHERGGLGNAYIASAPMQGAESGEPLPWKIPSGRRIRSGDVVTTEINASYGGYESQIHRPFAVGVPPTDRYRELYDLAERVCRDMIDALRPGNTARDVYEAVAPIEASEHEIYDVLLHGYGNGYFHPFIGTDASTYWPGIPDSTTAEWVFEENMVVVVQPNVVTTDERHGLQFGTTVVIESSGATDLHEFPMEFHQV